MSTKDVVKKLKLDGYKRLAKVKYQNQELRVFALMDEDGEMEDLVLAIQNEKEIYKYNNSEKWIKSIEKKLVENFTQDKELMIKNIHSELKKS